MLGIIDVGSSPKCKIQIEEKGVDEYHASLHLEEGVIFIELFPGCSAFINGSRVQGGFWLQPDDCLFIGTKQLNLRLIKEVLEGHEGVPLEALIISDSESFENISDAVVVKRNPWPAIIIGTVIIVVGVFIGLKISKYRKQKVQLQQEILLKQDSVKQTELLMDSLNERIKQIQIIEE